MRDINAPWGGVVSALINSGLPISLLALALFVGWRMPRPIVRGEFFREPRWLFLLWWELVRIVTPATVVGAMAWLLFFQSVET
jgi:hypothetical protein